MMIYEELKKAIFSAVPIINQQINRILSPIFGNSLSLSNLFVSILENDFYFLPDSPLPQYADTYAENYFKCLMVALKNGLDPNEILPYEDGETGGDNIMWELVGGSNHLDIAPKMLKALLDHGGDPNLRIGMHATIYSEADFFFFLDGEDISENLLKCWLLLAAYGGDKDNADYLPLRMLHDHKQDELKNYENYCFSFETPLPPIYKRSRVLFIVDKFTGEKVAVNETPFG